VKEVLNKGYHLVFFSDPPGLEEKAIRARGLWSVHELNAGMDLLW